MKKSKGLSLQTSLYIMIFTCWVVPLLLTVLWFGNQQRVQSQASTQESVVSSVGYAVSELERRLGDALVDSRSPSYDKVIGNAYAAYLQSDSQNLLYSTTYAYLEQQYSGNALFDASILVFHDVDGLRVMATRTGISDRSVRIREFTLAVEQTLLSQAQHIDTRAEFFQVGDTLYLVRNLMDSRYHCYATLILPLHLDYLTQGSVNVMWAEDIAVRIGDIYIPLVGDPQPLPQLDITHGDDDSQFTYGVADLVEDYPIQLEVAVHNPLLDGERQAIYQTLMVVVLLSGALFAIIIRYIYCNVAKPMTSLVQGAAQLEKGELGYQIAPLPKGVEFYALTREFNNLSTQLEQQFHRHTVELQSLQDAKIKALQSQINPHFLNNTLEMINWQARITGDDQVCQMISALSVMLNAAMARNQKSTVTMEEEFSYIEAYLFIISHRFGSRLQVRKDIDAAVWGAMVPRLILQPIVENAVEHGVALRTQGEINLHIYGQEDKMIIDVEHEGTISPADRQNIDRLLSWDGEENGQQGSGSIGIRNVQYRLKLLCGENSGLTIQEYQEGRVRSRIVPPLEFAQTGNIPK